MNFSLFLTGGLADYGAVMLFKAKTREISGKTVRSSFGRLLSMILLCIFIDRLMLG